MNESNASTKVGRLLRRRSATQKILLRGSQRLKTDKSPRTGKQEGGSVNDAPRAAGVEMAAAEGS